MGEPGEKHVFVSYVHEDSERVDALCKVLEASGIPYWRDRTSLAPGDAWKAKIKQAIRDGSLVFLACFSDNSRARSKSHMNEELTLAVEEFRKMPPGRTWLIPVRFDPGDLPEWDLGAGRSLDDLNYVDLFGDGYAPNAAALVTTVHRVMGEKRLSAASALAAVEQATSADRAVLLRRLTKDMLLEPTRRIELDEIVSQEVRRVANVLNDPSRVAGPLGGTNEQIVVEAARRAGEIWRLTEPFCFSLQVAARWASPEMLDPWVSGLQSFLAAPHRVEGGVELLLAQRHLPGMTAIVTATLATVAARKWDNLRTLVVEPTVRDRYANTALPLVEATAPYKPFGDSEWVACTLARAAIHGEDYAEALANFTQNRVGKYYSPASEWLHSVLRPVFAEQIPDNDTYDTEFDRMEVMLSVLAQDQANVRATPDFDGKLRPRSYWFGRATWRASHGRGNAAQDVASEFASQGARWGPLQAGLFGGDEDRARRALELHGEQFDEVAGRRF